MKITDPIDGKCPRCQSKVVDDIRYSMTNADEAEFRGVMCSECSWHQGDAVLACGYCGEVTDNLVKSDAGDDYCTTCKRQEDLKNAVASIMQAAMAVNFRTDYCVFVDLSGHVNWISIRLTKGKQAQDWSERIAEQTVWFDADDAVETLKRVHYTLSNIAVTHVLPNFKPDPQRYIFTERKPLLEVADTKAVAI